MPAEPARPAPHSVQRAPPLNVQNDKGDRAGTIRLRKEIFYRQCNTPPGGVRLASRLTASVIRRQVAAPLWSSPAASSSARAALSEGIASVRLREKGGKRHAMPCHHNLDEYLVAYLDGAGLRDDPKGPLFRTIGRGTGKLTRIVLPQANAYAMIRRRATAAGIETKLGNHSFRATGITAYLKNGGTLEKAAAMANHASTRTTQLYDRRATRSASMRWSGSWFDDDSDLEMPDLSEAEIRAKIADGTIFGLSIDTAVFDKYGCNLDFAVLNRLDQFKGSSTALLFSEIVVNELKLILLGMHSIPSASSRRRSGTKASDGRRASTSVRYLMLLRC
jgi:hypothetical protein